MPKPKIPYAVYAALPYEAVLDGRLTLTGARILWYIDRHRDAHSLSYDEFANGRWKDRAADERWDHGCGAALSSIEEEVPRLAKRGWIRRVNLKPGDRARARYHYTVLIGRTTPDSGVDETPRRAGPGPPKGGVRTPERRGPFCRQRK